MKPSFWFLASSTIYFFISLVSSTSITQRKYRRWKIHKVMKISSECIFFFSPNFQPIYATSLQFGIRFARHIAKLSLRRSLSSPGRRWEIIKLWRILWSQSLICTKTLYSIGPFFSSDNKLHDKYTIGCCVCSGSQKWRNRIRIWGIYSPKYNLYLYIGNLHDLNIFHFYSKHLCTLSILSVLFWW